MSNLDQEPNASSSSQTPIIEVSSKGNPQTAAYEVRKWQKQFFRLGTISLAGLLIWAFNQLCHYFDDVASIIGYSVLMAYLLIGAVDWIQTKTRIKRRGYAVSIVYSTIFLIIGLFTIFVIPPLLQQIKSLINQIPFFVERSREWLASYNDNIVNSGLPFPAIDIDRLFGQIDQNLNQYTTKALNRFLQLAFGTINFGIHLLAVIVLSVYFLMDGPRIWNGLIRPLSKKYLTHAERLRNDLSRCLRGYFGGQIKLASFTGIFVFLVYLSMGSKYALLLGVWQALVEIIPVVGGFLGIGLGVIVMLFDSPLKALIAFIAYNVYTQIFKDNFLTPRIMGDAIGLHPVVVILVVFIGAKVGGVSGVVFALPSAGLLNVIIDYYLRNRTEDDEINTGDLIVKG